VQTIYHPASTSWLPAGFISDGLMRAYGDSVPNLLAQGRLITEIDGVKWSAGSGAANLNYPVLSLHTGTYSSGENPGIEMHDNNFDPDFDVTVTGTFSVIGNAVGNFVVGNGFVANSAAIGVNETVITTLAAATFKAGRAYMLKLTGSVSASVAANNPLMRFHKTNALGLQIDQWRVYCNNINAPYDADHDAFMWVGAADVTASMVLTLQGSAGFNATMNGAAGAPYAFTIWDIGDAANIQSWAPQLT
jgi:hypothetical protein